MENLNKVSYDDSNKQETNENKVVKMQTIALEILRKKKEVTDTSIGLVTSKHGPTLSKFLNSENAKSYIKKEKTKAIEKGLWLESNEKSDEMKKWQMDSSNRRTSIIMRAIKEHSINKDKKDDENNDVEDNKFNITNGNGEASPNANNMKSDKKKGKDMDKYELLESTCRDAFKRDSESRSHMDLQSIKTWFQRTKLQISTDFENLKPFEMDLLCRRMILLSYYQNEIVFRQGDEGDALYVIFSGTAMVRVSQKVLGEDVEVVVCELNKGEFFGERALLNNEPRAATVLTKCPTELVRISREDYNVMLKQNQQEFLERMRRENIGMEHITFSTSDVLYRKILQKKPDARTKHDIISLSQFVQTMKFFRSLPVVFVRQLCAVLELLSMAANQVVFREGEIGDIFYVILSGSVDVKVRTLDKNGNVQQTKLIRLGEGAHFGELALMKGHGVRSATVITKDPTEFLIVHESDYNSILSRIQKDDLSKRVKLLDSIPMFQGPEWTPEILEELSYVLTEQRYGTGSIIYKQGEKSSQIFFITRGECISTRHLIDPKSNVHHDVFLERLGPHQAFGEDAANAAQFNEECYREETVIASTPVEVFVLTKYDVFHRLSKEARDVLRTHVKIKSSNINTLDAVYKTKKWLEIKRATIDNILIEKQNKKILKQLANGYISTLPTYSVPRRPSNFEHLPVTITTQVPNLQRGRKSTIYSYNHKLSGADQALSLFVDDGKEYVSKALGVIEKNAQKQSRDLSSINTIKLVNPEELLLVHPEKKQDLNKKEEVLLPSVSHYCLAYNPDIDINKQSNTYLQDRRKLLENTQKKVKSFKNEKLKEGNPFSYLNYAIEFNQTMNKKNSICQPVGTSIRLQLNESALTRAMNENYVISPIAMPSKHQNQPSVQETPRKSSLSNLCSRLESLKRKESQFIIL